MKGEFPFELPISTFSSSFKLSATPPTGKQAPPLFQPILCSQGWAGRVQEGAIPPFSLPESAQRRRGCAGILLGASLWGKVEPQREGSQRSSAQLKTLFKEEEQPGSRPEPLKRSGAADQNRLKSAQGWRLSRLHPAPGSVGHTRARLAHKKPWVCSNDGVLCTKRNQPTSLVPGFKGADAQNTNTVNRGENSLLFGFKPHLLTSTHRKPEEKLQRNINLRSFKAKHSRKQTLCSFKPAAGLKGATLGQNKEVPRGTMHPCSQEPLGMGTGEPGRTALV